MSKAWLISFICFCTLIAGIRYGLTRPEVPSKERRGPATFQDTPKTEPIREVAKDVEEHPDQYPPKTK